MPVIGDTADSTGVDRWWDSFIGSTSSVLTPKLAEITDSQIIKDDWRCIDEWWEAHIESEREMFVELQGVLEQSQSLWAGSDNRLQTDPLATDWVSNAKIQGPLRTNQEENWSQWLAHLIRSGPPAFSRELFGDRFEASPQSVKREVHLPSYDEPDRYADILVFYEGRAVSIEVKKGDEHFAKTIHTAKLIESQFRVDWKHFLLLPGDKRAALSHSFQDRLLDLEGETLEIESNRSRNVAVIYWLEVAEAIRKVLLSGIEIDPHWEASGYLFCTLIEQKLARFIPKQVVDKVVDSNDVVQTDSELVLMSSGIKQQIAYLRGITNKSHS